MKTNKKLLASAVALLISGIAHAQSTTTTDLGMGGVAAAGRGQHTQSSLDLYGILDLGVTDISNFNGKNLVAMASGINQGSRFGLKGTENLGGGLRAIFNLESEFFINNGNQAFPGIIFNRRALVGLTDRSYGTLLLGRDYDFLYDYISYYSDVAQFAPAYAFHLADDIDRLGGETVQNVVRYETPLYHGLQAGAMYGFDGGNSAATPHVLSFGIKYSPTGSLKAPYTLAAAYTKTVGGDTLVTGPLGMGATLAQMASGARSVYTAAIAGQMKLGNKFDLNGMFTYTNLGGITRTGPMVAKVTNVYELGLQYHPNWNWTLGLGDSWIDQHQSGHYDELSYGFDYRFTKRTDLFLFGTWMHAFGHAQNAGLFLATTPGVMNQGLPNSIVGLSTNRNQVASQVGIRHVF